MELSAVLKPSDEGGFVAFNPQSKGPGSLFQRGQARIFQRGGRNI